MNSIKLYAFVVVVFLLFSLSYSAADEKQEYLFRAAAGTGDTESVKEFLASGINVNASNQRGLTALILASAKGHTEIVRLLIEHGADINSKDDDLDTPIMEAIVNDNEEIVLLLLDNGADPNASDNIGFTPLMASAITGNAEIAGHLLNNGADTSMLSRGNKSAKMIAIENDNDDVRRLIEEHEERSKIKTTDSPTKLGSFLKYSGMFLFQVAIILAL